MADVVDPTLRYNRGARLFHMVIAVLVIANIALGLLHDPLEHTINLIAPHKSIGVTILVLSVLRLFWRFRWRTPDYRVPLTRGTLILSRAVHWSFYGLMIVLPLTGWLFTSVAKRPTTWFGLFRLPPLPVHKGDPIVDLSHQGHTLLGYAMAALVVLHVAAALRHQFILKDGLLRRMW
ncbi:MAG: cytochrome b [Novosphingobium sp.]|nr:cytochrome b [Novosphingobium sp.]